MLILEPISIQETETGTGTGTETETKMNFNSRDSRAKLSQNLSQKFVSTFSLCLSLPLISIRHLEFGTETSFETNSETTCSRR